MAKEVKEKVCAWKECDNTFKQFNSLNKYCSPPCQLKGKDFDRKGKAEKAKQTKQKLRAMGKGKSSSKLLKNLAKYRPIRDAYMEANPTCEVEGCYKFSTNNHHKAGRVGFWDEEARQGGLMLLWDVRFFMACCETCHPKRIHENPAWAREKGYILTPVG